MLDFQAAVESCRESTGTRNLDSTTALLQSSLSSTNSRLRAVGDAGADNDAVSFKDAVMAVRQYQEQERYIVLLGSSEIAC